MSAFLSASRRMSAAGWPLLLALSVLFSEAGLLATVRAESLAKKTPAGAVGYLETDGLESLIDRLQNSSARERLMESPQYQEFQKTDQYRKAEAGRKLAEVQLEMDLWTAAKVLVGGRVAVALYPHEGRKEPDLLVVLQSPNAEKLQQIRTRLEPLLIFASEKLEITELDGGGKRLVSKDGKGFLSTANDWVVFSNSSELEEKARTLLTGGEGAALASDPSYQAMQKQMGAEHLAQLFINLEPIKAAAGGRLGPEKLDNAGASLLFGGLLELAAHSPFVGVTADLEEHRVLVTSGLAGDTRQLDPAHRSFFSDPAGSGAPDLPAVPKLLGGFSYYLDLATWYRSREELLQAKVLPEFDKFESGLNNLLPGRDVSEDLLPLLGNSLTFLAAPQDYSHLDGKPGVQLPGFGLLIDLAEPEEGGKIFQMFFQTFSAILNIQAGEQGRQPWVISSESFQGVQVSYGQYLEKPKGDQLPIVYNFTPAWARVENKFIVSSSLGLCRQVIDRLQHPPEQPRTENRNLQIELHADPLADLLAANRSLIEARALQEGKPATQAQAELDLALEILRALDLLRITGKVVPEGYQLQFEGSWK